MEPFRTGHVGRIIADKENYNVYVDIEFPDERVYLLLDDEFELVDDEEGLIQWVTESLTQ